MAERMAGFLVGQGSGEQILVEAPSALAAAQKYAAEHPGTKDIFVSHDLQVPPGGAWQDVAVFPRNTL
jgi:hypothetical protein